MNDTIKTLLTAVYPKKVVEAVSNETIPEDFKLQDAIASMHTSVRDKNFEIFKNDEGEDSFRGQIIKEQDGKWTGTINNHIKKHGVNYDDVKDLPLTEKIKFLVDHIKEETSTSFTEKGKKTSDEVEKLQEKNLELTNQVTSIEEDRDTKVKEAEDNANSKIKGYKTQSSLKTRFRDIPAEQILGKKHTDPLFNTLVDHLNVKFDTVLDEEGKVGFHIKGTTQKAEGEKDGQKVILSTEDVLVQGIEELGFLVKSNGSGEGASTTTTTIKKDGDTKPVFKNQSAAMDANLALLKTAAES